MKIMFVANYMWDIYIFRAGVLRALVEDGHEVIAVAPDDGRIDMEKAIPGLRAISINLNKRGINPIEDLKLVKELHSLYKKENPDLVIINKPKDLRMLKGGNFKKVLIQHGDLETYKKGPFASKDVIELIQKELDYYIFLSDNSKELFLNFLKLNKNQGITIRHSCEVELLENKEKIKNKKLIIISRIENNQKRIDLAIKAMKKLPDFTLDIYGDGPHKEMLEQIVIEEGLEERVFFRGKTTKIKEALDKSSIFIMTSVSEGYPITTIEALTRGLPIVLRNTFESAPDIVQNNGILLEKEWDEDKFVESVYKVYENYDYYSKNSIEMGKRHTFEIIEKKWIEFLNGIIN